MGQLRTSPLHDRHAALGARFGEFGGWSMPLQYSSVVAEHRAVREAVGVFDVSHLGKARVTGPGARAHVDACLTNDLGRIGPGQAQYTLCCNDSGGVVDDLIAYLASDEEVFLIPNAANTDEVVRRLARGAPAGVEVTNEHTEHAILAVQGPRSDEVLTALGVDPSLAYMHFLPGEIAGHPLTVCRTGYTGERGVELVCRAEAAGAVWDAVLAAGEAFGVLPAGLGARDTLRTEMGYPLHGQDLSPAITPLEAGLSWAIGWDKPRFWGSDALRAEREAGPTHRLRALRAQGRSIPRPGMRVQDAEGRLVGTVTSGTFSPTLGVGIGLALLDAGVRLGDSVVVAIRSRTEPFTVAKPPLVQPSVRSS